MPTDSFKYRNFTVEYTPNRASYRFSILDAQQKLFSPEEKKLMESDSIYLAVNIVFTQALYPILYLQSLGYTSKLIGSKLCISPETVKNHKQQIVKLNSRSENRKAPFELIAFALARGYMLSPSFLETALANVPGALTLQKFYYLIKDKP